MLSAIWEAAQVEPALQPVRLSDANYADFGSFGVCQINAKTPPGFFFLKANHQALEVGANLFSVQGGEDLLAYRTPDDFTADEELDLTRSGADRPERPGERQRPCLHDHGPAARAAPPFSVRRLAGSDRPRRQRDGDVSPRRASIA